MAGDDSTMDKLKGKAKEAVGKVTGDSRLEGEGQTDQTKGKAKDAVQNAADKARGAKDSLTRKDDDA